MNSLKCCKIFAMQQLAEPQRRKQLSNLHVYGGAEHPHEAQKPETVDFAALNRKNARTA